MNDMAKSYYIGLLTVVCCLAAHLTAAAHPDDNVYLTDGTETWHLTISGDGSPVVRNTISHVYEATRYAENIQPFVTYNDRSTRPRAKGRHAMRTPHHITCFTTTTACAISTCASKGPARKLRLSSNEP